MIESPVPALDLTMLSKRFGGVVALDRASLAVRPGTVHALLGENGAGKTTLMRIAFGMIRPDSGTMQVDGRTMNFRSAADAIAAGIGMVHQHFTLVPAMTVAENLALGGHGRFDTRRASAQVERISASTGFALEPSARVESLSVGAQQRVEIAKALVRHARVLILDEPTAVLAPSEIRELLRWLRLFVEGGNAAVLVTHKLREAVAIADDVTVLRQGRLVHHGAAHESSERSLATAMVGTNRPLLDSTPERATGTPGRVVFEARHLSAGGGEFDGGRIDQATFQIAAGEIVGVVGVEGSGQRVLLRVLAGRVAPLSGTLVRPERVGFVPEDRHHDAILENRSLTDNVALRDAGERQGMISWKAMRTRTDALMRSYDIRAPNPSTPMRALSGGNQQKLVVARELAVEPSGASTDGARPSVEAIVVENPTRGLDVRASADVHAQLRAARDRGAAVVIYSGDIDEVLLLASRVLVVSAGVVHQSSLDRDVIGRAMLGLV